MAQATSRLRGSSVLPNLSSSHGESDEGGAPGDEGDEDREGRGEGLRQEGDEGDEGREGRGEGLQQEGDEGDEGRERRGEGHFREEGHEGHEVRCVSRLRCVDVATLVERRPHGVPLEALERGLWYVGSVYAPAVVCKSVPAKIAST